MNIKLIKSYAIDKKTTFMQRIWYKDWYLTITKPYHIVKNFFSRISRVLSYVPVVWNICDWDYAGAIDIFKYQLTRLADYLDSDSALTVDAKYNAQRIRTAIKLMDRIFDDYYSMEYLDILEARYGDHKISFKPIYNEEDTIKRYKMEETWIRNGKVTNREDIDDEYNKLFWKSIEKQEKAHRILWKLIQNNIRGWWY